MTSKKGRKTARILKVTIDSTSLERVLTFLQKEIESEAKKKPIFVTTPNPEIVLRAQEDKGLLEALNSSDLAIPDGFGLVLAGLFLGEGGPREVVHGRMVFERLCEQAAERGWKVFLLGGLDGVHEKATSNLKKKYKNLKIKSAQGSMLDNDAKPVSKRDTTLHIDILKSINEYKPDILFVAFGAPKQEKWIYKNLDKLKAKTAMTIGGAIDYAAGKKKEPPMLFEKLHLEWLWRLFTDRKTNFKRIVNALIVFPLKVVFERKD